MSEHNAFPMSYIHVNTTKKIATSKEYENAHVVVDYDEGGNIIGVEFIGLDVTNNNLQI